MSSPQPPASDNPFPGMGDQSLREHEHADHSLTQTRQRDPESAATLPPEIRPSSAPSESLPAIRATQAALQSACKRKRLSSSGTKNKLTERLCNVGVNSAQEVRQLAREFEEKGADEDVEASAKQKAPNWTKDEAARLCHVLADPRHATSIGRLYNKADNRAELDQGRHDPWSSDFVDLFNSDSFSPMLPEGKDGITDDVLLLFDPTQHPHQRTGAFLKARWNKLRSKYTVAREKYTRSGQGENDVFDSFTDGDDTLSYLHCVFYGLPALEAIIRALPEGSGVEAGLEEIQNARSDDQVSRSRKKRKTSNDNIADGLSEIAKAVSASVEVNINEKGNNSVPARFEEYDISDRMASTVTKLMTLESTIRANLRNATLDEDDDYIEELRNRLSNVQRRIDRALME